MGEWREREEEEEEEGGKIHHALHWSDPIRCGLWLSLAFLLRFGGKEYCHFGM